MVTPHSDDCRVDGKFQNQLSADLCEPASEPPVSEDADRCGSNRTRIELVKNGRQLGVKVCDFCIETLESDGVVGVRFQYCGPRKLGEPQTCNAHESCRDKALPSDGVV